MKRFYKNWPMHNIVAHPLMQIFEWLGMPEIATRVHDETLPAAPTSSAFVYTGERGSDLEGLLDGYDHGTAFYTSPQPALDCHHRPPCDECAAIAAQGGK